MRSLGAATPQSVRTISPVDTATNLDDGHELFVVEGESAADALSQVCRRGIQSVHAVQGKPMNVVRASPAAIWKNDRIVMLHHKIVGSPSAHLSPDWISYRRVILLTDANVDGVHAKALLLAIFAEVMPELIEQARLFTIRAPEYAVRCAERTTPVFAYSRQGRQSVFEQLVARGATKLSTQHYAGLAGMGDSELVQAFVDPATRKLSALDASHVAAARAVLR